MSSGERDVPGIFWLPSTFGCHTDVYDTTIYPVVQCPGCRLSIFLQTRLQLPSHVEIWDSVITLACVSYFLKGVMATQIVQNQ